MKQNLGSTDRILRSFAALALTACAVFAPLPLPLRVAALGGSAVYMLGSALVGSCLGYRLLGKSSCPSKSVL
jgi:Protein of unknown function (DUF2892)